jgi:CHAT domain-containing protein/tetratricopeptide (TPR) repeat protein
MTQFNFINKIIAANLQITALVFALAASTIFAQTGTLTDIRPLTSGQKIERKIKSEETHRYSVSLKQGEALRVDLLEKQANVAVSIKNAEQKEVFEYNLGEGLDREKFTFIVEQSGNYLLEVKAAPLQNGSYELNTTVAPTTEADKQTSAAGFLVKEGLALFKKGTAEGVMGAIPKWEQAMKTYAETGDVFSEAEMRGNLGVLYSMLGQKPKAMEYQLKALELNRKVGDKSKISKALANVATLYAQTGEKQKAIDYFEQALPLLRETGDKQYEAIVLTNIGAFYTELGENRKSLNTNLQAVPVIELLADKNTQAILLAAVFAGIGQNYTALSENAKALDYLQRGLELTKKTGNVRTQAYILNNLAVLHATLGERRKSLEAFQQVNALTKITGDKALASSALNNIAETQAFLGEKQKALETYQQVIQLAKTTGNKRHEAMALQSIGMNYGDLGEYEIAIKYLKQGLEIAKAAGLKNVENFALMNLGKVYQDKGEFDKAIEFHSQALSLAKETSDKPLEGAIYVNLSALFLKKKDLEKSLQFAQQAEQLAKSIGKIDVEAVALNNIGTIYGLTNNATKANEYFEKALLLERKTGDKRGEANTQGNLMSNWRNIGNLRIAIFYGKQAINNYQLLRGNISGLSEETQRAYTKTIERDYRKLAEILTEAGRFAEAEKVLSLLKEKEFSEFVRRDSEEVKQLGQRADLKPEELKLIERYNLLADRITEIGVEFQKLDEKKRRLKEGETLSTEEQKRYDELSAQLQDANGAFRIFLDKEIVAELGRPAKKEIEVDRALQTKLRQWGEGTVALYTIAGDDRYRVILTTPSVQTSGKSEIKIADLNKKIFAFREALTDPAIDPRPLGKELYDILIKPIEKDLQGARAKTLLWSLDGTLRYIPIAALWDGKQYLAQKYQTVVITSTTRQSLSADTTKKWEVLGVGVTNAQTVPNPIAPSEKISFSALPGVKTELTTIVRDEQIPTEKGILSGRKYLDTDFNVKNFADSLTRETTDGKRKYTVVHIASHFHLGNSAANSFLLLGDGKTLTLEQVADSPETTFENVELVTLSACNTAFGDDSTGKEVDSLATFIELRGAKAVMATLWAVADTSTQQLMSEFYRMQESNPNLSKSEALRQAQLSLLKNQEFTHPYFWSPFVLIGNWK